VGAFGLPIAFSLGLPADARATEADFIGLVQDVPSATAYRYSARDDRGYSLDGLKIIDNPQGGYLGVYHLHVGGVYYVKVGTSPDLINWRTRTVLASHGSQPTITRLSGDSFLVAYESDVGCIGAGAKLDAPNGRCLGFLHYPSVTALLTRKADRSVQVKRTLSRCAEGTPNIYAAHLSPDLDHSTIRVGLHYFRECRVDRQALGTLVNFAYWSTDVPQPPNATVQALGAVGNIGDRDAIGFVDGFTYRLIEGQLVSGDFSSWRTFLYSRAFGAKQLSIRTHRGSTAFANPTATWVRAPGGGVAIVFTQFIPLSGAAPGEAGELIYYRKVPWTDPVIAAAGDIACDPASASFNAGLGTANSCRQKYTADLLGTTPLAGVLALGDNQYEQGGLSQYAASYELSWGLFKNLTYPTVGNHEYGTTGAAGYFDYFNGTGNLDGRAGPRGKGYYSFDIGSWHLISLNSNCTHAGGCSASSPQAQWLRADLAAHPTACTLAFWHHPRFSSGQHGDAGLLEPLWQALYDANADLVVVGHDHLYERFGPQTSTGVADPVKGIREFVVGTGGRSHYNFNTPKPNSEVRNSDSFGILKLTLHPGSYDWAFIPEAGKTFTDFGSNNCH
jgi:hypothetical protein